MASWHEVNGALGSDAFHTSSSHPSIQIDAQQESACSAVDLGSSLLRGVPDSIKDTLLKASCLA